VRQHGVVAGADPDQGDDAAVHLVRRFLCAGDCTRYGHAAGADPASTPWRRAMRGPSVQPIVIAAGGTGGHFFPAEALASALVARGHRIVLMTDARSGGLSSAVFA